MVKAKQIILHHHERIDGHGYPYGLKGDEIPLLARIVSVADAFDAMTSDRCYDKARSTLDALKTIYNDRGKHFDPRVTDIFLGLGEDLV